MIGLLLALLAPASAQAPAPTPPPPAPAPPVPAPGPVAAAHETAIAASLVVAVVQKDAVADAIVAKTRALGGWFQARDAGSLSLRVPVENAEALLAFAGEQGKVLDRSFSRQDLSRQLVDLRGRLAARQSVLKQYDAVLTTASAASIVSVQRSILAVIREMEHYQGQIKLLEDQGRYARVNLSFQFLDRSAPARDGSSSFRWLNTLNVQDEIWGMQQPKPSWKSGGVAVPSPPTGFSAWKKKGHYRATSPDGAMFRVRTEKHKPKAELDFWKEAVRERMVAAGYKLVAESAIEAGGVQGGLVELAAPIGTEDWTYVIAFFPNGGKMVIAEAAAEVTVFDAHRDALLATMKSLSP